MVGKQQQRTPFSPGLASFSPRVVLAVFIVPSQSRQVYLERKLEALTCVHHHEGESGFSRARAGHVSGFQSGLLVF